MPSTMQMGEPEVGVPAGLRLLSTDPGAGASDGMSHETETLEQKLVPMPPVGAGTDPRALWRVWD